MNSIINPFVTKGYVSKQFFCDREEELKMLRSNFLNGINTTLISPRRMGKTGLIYRLFEELATDKDIETIYIDIYPSRTISDFIKFFAEAILKKFPEKTNFGQKFLQFIKGFRPSLSFDALTGEPQISILYQSEQQKELTIRSLFEFIDSQNKTILIAIDEFQQINEYPEGNMEALLRTYINQLHNIRFIFCGSKKSMMIDMFSSAKRPFYASSQFLSLECIDRKNYSSFIEATFGKFDVSITQEALDFILEWTNTHTFYTQSLCNKLFSNRIKHIDVEQVKEACVALLKNYEAVYLQYRQLLTVAQWNFLIALAKQNVVRQITAQDFIQKYNIGTPANARRINKALIEKELVLMYTTKNGASYQVYDVFFSRWLELEYS